jgi:hypothetical protein
MDKIDMKEGQKVECKFCHQMYYRNGVDMCGKCHDEYISRRDFIDSLENKKSKKKAIKMYEDHMKTMGDNPDRAWFEKKRLLASNILRYEDNKIFL